MNRLPKRFLKLSVNQRALLKTLLQEEGITDSSLPAITRRQDTTALPLSFAQQRLRFLDQLEPASPVYNITRSFSLVGSLRLTTLEQSIREVARRHEALRTIFPVIDGRAVQVILPDLPAPILAVIDLTGLDQNMKEARLQQVADEEARRSFDLSRGPLLRVQLLRESATAHILFLSVHHIVCDGWSLDLLIREISTLYQAYAQDQPSPLPELSIQYADYTLWQRAWLQGSTLTDQLTYWQEHLRGAPTTLELAMKQRRPGEHSFQGARYTYELSRELADALTSLSQREHATLFMTLLAAFSALLARYSGQNDLVIGVPIANRTRAEVKDLIGNFANTLALRLNLSGAPRFQSLLAQVREVCLAGYAHQDLPFESLVEALEPERSLHHTPLFQVMFTFQGDQIQELLLHDLTVNPILPGHSATARTNLMLMVGSNAAGLHLDFEYRTDLFDASAIARMAAHLQQLLESIVSHPWRSLADLAMLIPTEQQSLLDWNATQQLYAQNQCLHQRFEAQAEQHPARVALVYQDEQLTYSELNRRANRLAHHLRGLGVRPEKPIGLCLERDLELIVALLAILKTGGAYISLDPRYPSERLAFMLNDAGAACLITRRAWQDRPVLPPSVPTIYLDELAEQLDQESEANLENRALSANLAYVIYTSGSTGRPKGVAITHRSALALLAWAEREFPAALLTGVLASTSLNFDLSIFELFLPLCNGGSIILARDALQLAELPAAQGATLLNTVPSVLTALLETGDLPASVRVVALAGEPLSASLVRRLYALGTVQRVYNLYGPTEDTTYSTWALLPPDPGESVPIGRPISNTRAYLLDEFLAPLPIGCVGELYLAGEGLARGYLHQ
ncbi:MAG TPA: condensation domain-containing protein, partial [Ktedonobacteraceae bacterium]